MNKAIQVQNLKKTFHLSKKQQKTMGLHQPELVAVDHLNFQVTQGEVFGILGPNGAGKTTTLRMMSTLIQPDEGDIMIQGASILTDPNQVRRNIGFLTSELKLDDVFTPNYLFQYFATLYGMTDEEMQRRKTYLFEKFGISDYAEIKIGNLSTGNKQKVSLIISLVHDPDIIIFDEPTNGLDIITAKIVTDFLKEQKAQGKTIVLSSHIFSLVEDLCDRVAIIINGKMVTCDRVDRLCQEQSLEHVFFDLYQEVTNEN